MAATTLVEDDDEARQLFTEYKPVVRDFVYCDKTLWANDNDKNAVSNSKEEAALI